MPDTKISQLNGGVTVIPESGDLFPMARGGQNYPVDYADIAVPSDFQIGIVSGNYYYSSAAAFSLQGLYGDVLTAFPIWFSSTETWTRIGFKLKYEDTGKSVRIGIYENGGLNNLPGALLFDAGVVSLDVAGNLEVTISQELQRNTVYWLAAVADTDPSSPNAYTTGYTSVVSNGVTLSRLNSVLGSTEAVDPGALTGVLGVTRAFPYAALPDPFGAASYGSDSPGIWLRKV